MKTRWWEDLRDDEVRGERAEMVKSAKPVLDILRGILEKDIALKQAANLALKNYETAAWPYLQAEVNGEMRALQNVISLLTLEESK